MKLLIRRVFYPLLIDKTFQWLTPFIVILNGLIWFLWLLKIQQPTGPANYATAILIINLVFGFNIFHREKIASYIVLSFALFIQLLILVLVWNILSVG